MCYPRSSLEMYLNSYAQNILFKILGKVFEGETSEKNRVSVRLQVSAGCGGTSCNLSTWETEAEESAHV